MKRVIFVLAIVFLLAGCGGYSVADFGEIKETQEGDGFKYAILYIEGMTCVWITDRLDRGGYGGLTCNWSEWRGN
jgi:hypothetical protein